MSLEKSLVDQCANSDRCRVQPSVKAEYVILRDGWREEVVVKRFCQSHGTKFAIHAPKGTTFTRIPMPLYIPKREGKS